MDGLLQLLEAIRKNGRITGQFRGLLHVLVGRRISTSDGVVLSAGQTWRQVAALLKRARWDKSMVAELGMDMADLPPRDRERYWYAAIHRADLDGELARKQAEAVAGNLLSLGYEIGPAPR